MYILPIFLILSPSPNIITHIMTVGKSGFIVWRYLLRRDDDEPAPWTPEGKPKAEEYYRKGTQQVELQQQLLQQQKLSSSFYTPVPPTHQKRKKDHPELQEGEGESGEEEEEEEEKGANSEVGILVCADLSTYTTATTPTAITTQ